VNRSSEELRFSPFEQLTNHQLLWHGSRVSNFVGILKNGLKIAPPEAPTTGYLFGKGIYLTDCSSKAATYCHASKKNTEGLLILTETALGTQHVVHKPKQFIAPPTYCHSVLAVGEKKPKVSGLADLNTSDKKLDMATAGSSKSLLFNTGELTENSDWAEFNKTATDDKKGNLKVNEMVVYDEAQVKLRYVVHVKFEFE